MQSNAAVQNYRDLAAAGASAFQWVAIFNWALSASSLPSSWPGDAQESNPKNWDVLLTTPPSTPRSCWATLRSPVLRPRPARVLAPAFAITQYFGGVPGRAVLMSYLVSAAAALLVGAIAIALAVNRLAGRRAFTFTPPSSPTSASPLPSTRPARRLARRAWRRHRLHADQPFLAGGPAPAVFVPRPDAVARRHGVLRPPVVRQPGRGVAGSASAESGDVPRGARSPSGRSARRRCAVVPQDVRPRRAMPTPAPLMRSGTTRSPGAKPRPGPTLSPNSSRAGVLSPLWGIGLTIAYHRAGLDHEGFRFAMLATFLTEFRGHRAHRHQHERDRH